MPSMAYERRLKDNKHLLRRQHATALASGTNKSFVQIYNKYGGYLDANNLRPWYTEDLLNESEFQVEPCKFLPEIPGWDDKPIRAPHFTRGQRGAEGVCRYWYPGKSVPDLIKDAIQKHCYATIKNDLSEPVKIKLINKIDTLKLQEPSHGEKLLEGMLWYIEEHIITTYHINRDRLPEVKEAIIETFSLSSWG